MDALHLSNFLEFSMSPLEIFIRGSITSWCLFLLLRFLLRRDTGPAGISGILFVVLLGDAAQNAMIGNGHAVADGGILIAILAAWNLLLDWLGIHFKLIARLTEAPPVLLVRNGRLMDRNMRRELVTRGEIEAGLRQKGLESFERVKAMYMEGDGSFSIIKSKGRAEPLASPGDRGNGARRVSRGRPPIRRRPFVAKGRGVFTMRTRPPLRLP
jgi:uncharacterized membrane protein YcaP (DUF421 family)